MNSTTQNSATRLTRFLRSPLGWLAVGIIAVGVPSALAGASPVIALPGAGLALVAYWAVMRFTARRATPEISAAGRAATCSAAPGSALPSCSSRSP